jgi:hypothetical protein
VSYAPCAPQGHLKRAPARILFVSVLLAYAICAQSAAAADMTSTEIWCLLPGNRPQVATTAELLGFGRVSHTSRSLIVPHGSSRRLTLKEWRLLERASFERACTKAFEASRGSALTSKEVGSLEGSIDSLRPKGISGAESDALVGGIGVGGAVVGAFGTYLLDKRTRKDERDFAYAADRVRELTLLSSQVDQLAEKLRAETAEPADFQRARELAMNLRQGIPAGAEQGDEALSALDTLLSTLDSPVEPDDPTRGVKRLRQAAGDVQDTTWAVISHMHRAMPRSVAAHRSMPLSTTC